MVGPTTTRKEQRGRVGSEEVSFRDLDSYCALSDVRGLNPLPPKQRRLHGSARGKEATGSRRRRRRRTCKVRCDRRRNRDNMKIRLLSFKRRQSISGPRLPPGSASQRGGGKRTQT